MEHTDYFAHTYVPETDAQIASHFNEHFFNLNKNDYTKPSIFLGEPISLLDTIHQPLKQLKDLADRLKALDWSENEFPLHTCKGDFKSADKDLAEIMLINLAYQWETDTVAAKHTYPILAPFLSSSEAIDYFTEEARNEKLHGNVYSNIIRSSFDDPEEGMREILKRRQALARLSRVADVYEETRIASHRYALGMIPNTQELYNQVFKFIVAKLCMEGLQFPVSFSTTFLTTETGLFNPIGKNVEKICQDELEIHTRSGVIILDYELQTDRGLMAFNKVRKWIPQFIDSIIRSEFDFCDYLHQNGRKVPFATSRQIKSFVLYKAGEVCDMIGIRPWFDVPAKHPLPRIKDRFNISLIQGSPQEEKTGMYMLGEIIRDLEDGPMIFDFGRIS